MNIVLIGVMGAGKTTIGRSIANERSMEFVDMDEFLENYFNRSIDDFFKESEKAFRDAETTIAKLLSSKNNLVISTGGGVVLRPENMEALKKNSIVIFLERDLGEIISKVDHRNRPLLRDHPEKLYEIMEKRKSLYEKYADITFLNNQSIDQTLNNLLKELEVYENNEIYDH